MLMQIQINKMHTTQLLRAENIINATSQPTLDPSAVTQAANQVNTNKTALNGVQNLANKSKKRLLTSTTKSFK